MSRIGNLVKKVQSYKGQEFKQPKMFVPSGMIVPETAKSSMARQLYQAGVISKDDYEKMLGVVYDSDDPKFVEDFSDEAFSTFDDEFKLSELSEYYDDYGLDGEGDRTSEGSRIQEPTDNAPRTEGVQEANGSSTGGTDEKTVVRVEEHGKESSSR